MLNIYNSLTDVPEALREHYEQSGGKYVPVVSDDHPLKVNNTRLLNEKSTAESKVTSLETKVTKLEGDVTSAQAGSVPRGQRLVSAADAEELIKYKALGTVDEVTAKTTEHATLKASDDKRKREDSLRVTAKDLGFDNVEAFILLQDLPEFETREAAGKKTVIAKVKDDKGVITEKPAMEFLESSPRVSPFLPLLKTKPEGVAVHGSVGDTAKTDDPFKWAREFGKQYSENAKPAADLVTAFNERRLA